MLRASGASVIGPSHISDGLPNQDALSIHGCRRGWVVAVADGLGSKPMSHFGSRLATRTVREILRQRGGWEEPRSQIERIYRAWLARLAGKPPADAATTLLIADCMANGECWVAQLGDGLVLYRAAGKTGALQHPRNGFCNETVALGTTKSWADWQVKKLTLSSPGDGVILMSDGISDDLEPSKIQGFFTMMASTLAKRSRKAGRKWIAQQLISWPTAGHSDDKTLAMIFRDSR